MNPIEKTFKTATRVLQRIAAKFKRLTIRFGDDDPLSNDEWFEPPATRLDLFLDYNDDCEVWIVVGCASPAGLAWLNNRTIGRGVRLLIHDTRRKHWRRATSRDFTRCRSFLERDDVQIHVTDQGSRTAAVPRFEACIAHSDADPDPDLVAVLVGPVDLTRKGLEDSKVLLIEAGVTDTRRAWRIVSDLWERSTPCKERLSGYLDEIAPNDRTN